MKTFKQFSEAANGETVDGKFMSYATMKAKGIKPKQSAVQKVKSDIESRYGKGAIYDPKSEKPPSAEAQAAVAAERKKRQDDENKAFAKRAKKAGYDNPQDYANVVARYGGEDNYREPNKRGGLGS